LADGTAPPFEQVPDSGIIGSWPLSAERALCVTIEEASPFPLGKLDARGWFDETLFQSVAESIDSADWLDVTLHSYRPRWDEAAFDPDSEWLEHTIKKTPTPSLPATYSKAK
jgi:hypothetical protein